MAIYAAAKLALLSHDLVLLDTKRRFQRRLPGPRKSRSSRHNHTEEHIKVHIYDHAHFRSFKLERVPLKHVFPRAYGPAGLRA
jgi:hypothetical protein